MKKLIPIVFGGAGAATLVGDLALAVLRVSLGLLIAAHGLPKIPPSEGFIAMTGNLGFPMPTLAAWGAGLTELVGGLLLALGLLVRPSAVLLVFTMGVAAFVAHWDDPFMNKPNAQGLAAGKEFAMLYLIPFLAFIVLGAGRTGLDSLIHKRPV